MDYMESIDRIGQERPFATILGSALAFGVLTGIEVGGGVGAVVAGVLFALFPVAVLAGGIIGVVVGAILGLPTGLICGLLLASGAKGLSRKGARMIGALSGFLASLLIGLISYSGFAEFWKACVLLTALTVPFGIWRAPRVLYGKKPRESADPAPAPNLPDSDWQDDEPSGHLPADPWDAIPSDAVPSAHDPSGS